MTQQHTGHWNGLTNNACNVITALQGADGEYADMITGSELVIAGGILKKEGDKRFTCFGNENEYY